MIMVDPPYNGRTRPCPGDGGAPRRQARVGPTATTKAQAQTLRHNGCCPCHFLRAAVDAAASADEEGGLLLLVGGIRPRLEERSRAAAERDRLRAWCGERIPTLREEEERRSVAVGGDGASAGDCDLPLCSSEVESATMRLSRLRDESLLLRSDLAAARRACGEVSVRVAAATVRNDGREVAVRSERAAVDNARDGLERVWDAVLERPGEAPAAAADEEDAGVAEGECATASRSGAAAAATAGSGVGSLPGAIAGLASEVRRLRFDLALRAFEVHRVDVGLPDYYGQDDGDGQIGGEKDTGDGVTTGADAATGRSKAELALSRNRRSRRVPRGVGKIGGLPLPHAGPALFGVLPPPVLASSLRLLASLTATIARCLGIVLPHPILLRPLVVAAPTAALAAQKSPIHNKPRSQQGWNSYQFYRVAALAKAQTALCGDIADTVHLDPGWDDELRLAASEYDNVDNNSSKSAEARAGIGGHSLAGRGQQGFGQSGHHSATPLPLPFQLASSTSPSSSTSSLMFLGRTALRAVARATSGGDAPTTLAMSFSERTGASSSSSRPDSGGGQDVPTTLPPTMTGGQAAPVRAHLPSVDAVSVAARVRHASAAVIREGHAGGGDGAGIGAAEYALIPPGWRVGGPAKEDDDAASSMVTARAAASGSEQHHGTCPCTSTPTSPSLDPRAVEERFSTGLQLLQNNVVALCIRAGVPVSGMWPAEAPLLNLDALRAHLVDGLG